jgi:hypothetical protein
MRLQAALEYLTTYGWAILILAAVLVVVFSLRLFNVGNYVSTECAMGAGFSCSGATITESGVLSARISQSTSGPINITAVGCTENGTITNMQQVINPPSNQIYVPIGGTYGVSVQCFTNQSVAFSGTPGEVFSGTLILNYTDEITGIENVALGKIVAKAT